MSRIVLSEEQRKAFSDLFNVNSRFMRTVMGVVNNAAWMTCLDAIDQIRKHPRYRQNIKGSTTPMRQFKRCSDMLKDYEKRLKYGQKFPFFHVGNFTKETRDTFADNFTDNDYYDLWAASGFTVYSENRAMVTSCKTNCGWLISTMATRNPTSWVGQRHHNAPSTLPRDVGSLVSSPATRRKSNIDNTTCLSRTTIGASSTRISTLPR